MRQSFLDELSEKNSKPNNKYLKLLNWNIANPSINKAHKQAEFIKKNKFDILVLTEIKNSEGCKFLRDRLQSLNYQVYFPYINSDEDNYGTLIAIKKHIKSTLLNLDVNFLAHRIPSINCQIKNKSITITGVYHPPTNNNHREAFLKELKKFLQSQNQENWIVLGDLNIPRPDLIVKSETDQYNTKISREIYNSFLDSKLIDTFHHLNQKREPSIVRKNKGYRPDNIFISKNLINTLKNCSFIHQARSSGLSDHSPMILTLNI